MPHMVHPQREASMTAYLISLALAGLVAIAVWEDSRERGVFPAYLAAPQPQINFNPQSKTRNAFVMAGTSPAMTSSVAK
jgi:hypothetical protein